VVCENAGKPLRQAVVRLSAVGNFYGSHRFPFKAEAMAWAGGERVDVERGWKE
jgi:hypothetical protein